MITRLTISHFKAISSAVIELGPITVLVGPNDSGKSTVLQALMALSRCGDPARLSAEQVLGHPPLVVTTRGESSSEIVLGADGIAADDAAIHGTDPPSAYHYTTCVSPQQNVFVNESIEWGDFPRLTAAYGEPVLFADHRSELWHGTSSVLSLVANGPWINRAGPKISTGRDGLLDTIAQQAQHWPGKSGFQAIGRDLSATLLRLDARAIAAPSQLTAPVLPDGSGLVRIVDELLTSGTGDEQIQRVNEVIRKLSPHAKGVAAKMHPSGGKELHFALRSGAVVPASQTSDGLVLAAALVLISTWAGNSRLLIEEPENGLHPRQLRVVAEAIRDIAGTQGTQVVLTTHSPLLLNHFAADEVLVVTRDSAGVHAQRMSEASGIDDLASEMALGELWYNVGDSKLARPS